MAQAISPDPPVAPESSSFQTDRELAGFSPVPDVECLLTELHKIIRDGQISLPAMLQHIAEAAQTITGASGTAIAIRHDNSVICQATAGDMAPPLGTKLDMDSGISGRCLRMGVAMRCYDTYDDPRVDVNVCQRLGLRSLAVLPVGRKPVLGILEVFSALPNDFGDADMKALEQLAELVIAAQRRAAELATQKLKEKLIEEAPPRWSKHNLILVAPSVLVLLVWLLFREKPAHSSAIPVNLVTQSLASPVATTSSAEDLKLDSSPALRVWSTPAKARSGLVMASKTEKAASSKPVIVFWAAPVSDSKKTPPAADSLATPVPPVLATLSPGSDTALHGLLPTSTSLPRADIKVSQGVSGGTLERRVDPIYPPEAHARRLEGRVLLQALVAEDGAVRDLKVLQGDPLLAHAAMEAVSQWRYRPYLLNGQPVPMKTEITLIFKLP
jgi:TonB family protein